MENETTNKSPIHETHQVKEIPTLWKWYFGWHPRILITVPIFLYFIYSGLWFIWAEIGDVIYFFQTKPVTWGSMFLIMFFGIFLFWFLLAPVLISFYSISWLYGMITRNYTAWKKFLYSTGIFLLVIVGTNLIHLFTLWILGIL